MVLELFVGFIQAFIFAKLTLVFIAISTNEEKGH
jgi:F0F1-type ATP synthase membrane subunit a